jgi:hypothetical protein
MKTRHVVVTSIMAVALMGGAVQTQAAVYDFTVDASQTWNAFFAGSLWEGGYGLGDLRTTLTDNGGPPDDMISLQSNLLAQDADPAWNGVVLTLSSYQEVVGAVGDTVNFDFFTIADTLSAQGYVAEGFIKVLDGGASWATTQEESALLTVGSYELLSLTVADAGVGTEVVQAGFRIIGLSDVTGGVTENLSVNVIPEPATMGLLGVFGGALLFIRRRFRV